jgi:hypothetical protein
MEHPIFYIAQERAFAPGIVKEWPTVFTMPSVPHGRLVIQTHAQVIDELRKLGYTITPPPNRPIFVFGSNLAGRHGKGAALHARQTHGAVYGQGVGLQGNSYAIPTKDADLRPITLSIIRGYVQDFLAFARQHAELKFEVTRIGCGLVGYSDEQIAPMFKDAPTNCILPEGWRK